MGVYIKGKRKPDTCYDCDFVDGSDDCFFGLGYTGDMCDCVYEDCPLIEVKTPHGRLIDAYIVEEQLKEIEVITAMVDIELGDDPEEGEISIPLFTIRNIHKKAQSVIEAEESE